MPGIVPYSTATEIDNRQRVNWIQLQSSATGTTPPNAPIQYGDIICISSLSALVTASGYTSAPFVARKLLAADKTAHYLTSAVASGIFGVALDGASTDFAGHIISNSYPGGFVFDLPNQSSSVPPDRITTRNLLPVMPFLPGYYFSAGINLNITDFPLGTYPTYTLTNQLNGILAGLILSTSAAGVTTYSIQPVPSTGGVVAGQGAASADAIIRIIRTDDRDPNFQKPLVPGGGIFPNVIFEVLPTYQQAVNMLAYTAQ